MCACKNTTQTNLDGSNPISTEHKLTSHAHVYAHTCARTYTHTHTNLYMYMSDTFNHLSQ